MKNENGQDMWRVWGRGQVHARFSWGNLREDLEDLGLDGRIILKSVKK